MNGAQENPLYDEADRIVRYLLGVPATRRECELYADAQEKLAIHLGPRDEAILRAALASPLMTRLVDGGLALTEPQSLVRKKLFVMLAILEASPGHCDAFLSEPFGIGGLLMLGLRAARAGAEGILGAIYLAILRMDAPPEG